MSEVRPDRGSFESTHWSAVLLAAQSGVIQAEDALSKLCQDYWYPLYAFLRRKGLDVERSKDLTQEFFATRVVTKKIFHGVRPENGKFRTWLLNSLQNMMCNEMDRQLAQKRGAGAQHVDLNLEGAEARYLQGGEEYANPEMAFDQSWALDLLAQAKQQMETGYRQSGKLDLFNELKSFLPGAAAAGTCAEAAARLGKTEETLKVAIHRFRQEFGKAVRAQIRRTVGTENEVDGELRYLLSIMGPKS